MSKRAIVLCALGLVSSAPAWADQALLTHVNGRVLVDGKNGVYPAPLFAKLSAGDVLSLAGDAKVRIVYLDNGRQETWAGAAEVKIGGLEGQSPGPDPAVKQLSPIVVQQLSKTPANADRARSGMMQVRSVDVEEALEVLDRHYDELKRGATDQDTTPEAFLLSGLVEHRQYARARTLLTKLKDNPNYKRVVEHFTPLVRR
jgi:hypothetical protein